MTTIRFLAADQRRFAALSGDRNPVHLDAVVARRLAAGEPIVHGMHLLLRMLDLHSRRTRASELAIEATFLHPAFVGEPIAVHAGVAGELVAEASGGVRVALASIQPAKASAITATIADGGRRRGLPTRPRVRTLSDVEGAHGAFATKPSAAVARAFPSAVRALGGDVVAALASLSALVGMECPGRDSLLSAVRLRVRPRSPVRAIAWRVIRVDRRFGLVRIDVAGDGFAGTVDAFVRPQAVPPPPLGEVAGRVRAAEFDAHRALVVGGSRGLGAVTAMVIATGGGLPVITYASGAGEARALRQTLRAAGHRAEMLRLDVTSADAGAIVARAVKQFDITHLYYFATPRIFARRGNRPFDATLFDRFAEVYVRAFARVCVAATGHRERVEVFYPSSDAVTETPTALTEYAAAKAAGESVAAAIGRADNGLGVFVSRLPRVATDQTASIVATAAAAALDVALPIAREMHRRRSERMR